MAIKGHVNGMAGAYVIGWALCDATTHCEITISDAQGQVLASGRASQRRPDLISVGAGRTDFAFRIAVDNAAARHLLHVRADGKELAGSPLTAGAGAYDGDCAIVKATVTGWVTERVSGFSPPAIRILNQHGTVVGAGEAVLEAAPADPLYNPARFAIELDDQCFGCGELRLRVLVNGVKLAERPLVLRLASNLDAITDESYTGWLVSPDVPERALNFDVFQDGVLAGQGHCTLGREDVRAVHPGCVTPGFSLTLSKPGHSILDATAVSFRFRGSDLELFEGPYIVGSRPAAVVTAQRAAAAQLGFAGLDPAERAVVQAALQEFIESRRQGDGFVGRRQPPVPVAENLGPALTIIIPVYRDLEMTRACVQSVLAHRDAALHHVVLINDASPEPEMAAMLNGFSNAANLFVLTNKSNLGFVKTVNRGMSFALGGDVLLLNADTVMFAGGVAELCRVAAAPEIGTVTALSSNATIFSYPNDALKRETLDDIGWAELAEIALAESAGLSIDVPTGHGFCLLIKGEVLRRVGVMDEAFGRGYGEENDFCMRATMLGYRNVAAAGVLVVHRESASFGAEKTALLAENLAVLAARYPEYDAVIKTFRERDGLRRARWALDRARLRRAVQAGRRFVLLVTNALEGGTVRAVEEIEAASGDGVAVRLTLIAQENGLIELSGETPLLRAAFAPDEMAELFALLAASEPRRLMVHQLLGFPAAFIRRIGEWARELPSFYYTHDFYALCPRVTMIDAIGEFCDVADTDTCARCVKLGGAHEASRLTALTPAAHRALFATALRGFRQVVAPSANAVWYLRRVFADLDIRPVPHPEPARQVAAAPRTGGDDEIVLLGAIGAHKGSAKLLEIARRARLSNPALRFRVIGYTDIDAALSELGNVTITGKYTAEELPALVAQTRGRFALFLQAWPETYSYTLSEVARFGFIPLVPDIGAPAERVRATGFGVVFPFPVDPPQVLNLIEELTAGRASPFKDGAMPALLYPDQDQLQKTRDLLGDQEAAQPPRAAVIAAAEISHGGENGLERGLASSAEAGEEVAVKRGVGGGLKRGVGAAQRRPG